MPWPTIARNGMLLSAMALAPINLAFAQRDQLGRDPNASDDALPWFGTAQSGDPSPGSLFRDGLNGGGWGPQMVVVPEGRFRMGCQSGVDCRESEMPVHEVRVDHAFAIGALEVTFAEWDACAWAGGCLGHPFDGGWGRNDRPVINVSWSDAQSYVAWLSTASGQSYRLPSEAEWEYAARAGTTTRYSWGDEAGFSRANCDGCGSPWDDRQTAPGRTFEANAWGLHNMHGNVWEWVYDCWNDNYDGAPADGSEWLAGQCLQRVYRGGAWDMSPAGLRAAYRGRAATTHRVHSLGFRVARAL